MQTNLVVGYKEKDETTNIIKAKVGFYKSSV